MQCRRKDAYIAGVGTDSGIFSLSMRGLNPKVVDIGLTMHTWKYNVPSRAKLSYSNVSVENPPAAMRLFGSSSENQSIYTH